MYSERMGNVKSSAIRDILKLMARPGMISFAGGLPAPELFPVKEIAASADAVLKKYGAAALQYSVTEGIMPLREKIAKMLGPDKKQLTVENVIITHGSQQALDLLSKVFIDNGSPVITENPSYLGALQSFQLFQAKVLAVPSDGSGINTSLLRDRLKKEKPRFVYLMPNFQNPTGLSYSLERRKELAALAREYDVIIVEDDPYGALRFEGERMPSIFSLTKGGNVVYLSTFSKTIAPGLRVAYVAGDADLLKKLVIAKQGTDLQTNTFGQYIVNEYLESGHYQKHIDMVTQTYRERRDVMLAALERLFPKSVSWNKPSGGMFFWVRLPDGADAGVILNKCIEHNVAFVPGVEFYPDGSGKNTMRLNFTNATATDIEQGIKRLAEVLKENGL
ncbi:MAG TPA: PLP-dependent aminotransferase family protein [Nitrospirota bacterium]|nr:PLP-dependent aminotransferase family protein [Nitrospirota bacterium]